MKDIVRPFSNEKVSKIPMLSRKQLWRKTRSSSIVRRDECPSQDSELDSSELKSCHNDSVDSSKTQLPKKLRSALNLINLLSEADKALRPKDTRTMRFSSTVHICLIPSRTELKHLIAELFWRSEDYGIFKGDAVNELRTYLTANGISAKEAIFRLYQPHEEERKQWRKEYFSPIDRDGETDKDESSHSSVSSNPDADDQEESETAYRSDDDDDPTYGDDLEGLNRFSGLKTDIELNAEIKQRSGSISKMPTKTPAGANSDNQNVWAVSWKPKQTL